MFEYRSTLIRIIDGDTVELNVDLGFWVHIHSTMRLRGIDTPELNSRDPVLRAKAVEAKAYLVSRLPRATNAILVTTYKDDEDKYGRMLVDIYVDGVHINKELVDLGLAVAYMT